MELSSSTTRMVGTVEATLRVRRRRRRRRRREDNRGRQRRQGLELAAVHREVAVVAVERRAEAGQLGGAAADCREVDAGALDADRVPAAEEAESDPLAAV